MSFVEWGSLIEFLQREHSDHPKHPQILIAGSSLSGMGFHVEELERRMGMPAAKVTLSGGKNTDALDICECYPQECQHAKMLFLELAPQRLDTGSGVEKRRRFFDKIRGVKKSDLFAEYRERSSLSYFIQSCRDRLEQKNINESSLRYFESRWDNSKFAASKETKRIALRQRAEQARTDRANLIFKPQSLVVRRTEEQYDEQQIASVYRLLDLCRSRNIFVVICITPEWYGQLNFSQKDLDIPTDEPYLSLLQKLNKRPDCTVIICRDFEEITTEGTDEDYLFDYGHMTRQGAILYTNWLVDQLLGSPKTAEWVPSNKTVF
ncbi:MAG: hypothetical protein LBI05_03025 [Planctomycetaceae bacterium]|jgi:hypothetical protein|nr:hypothetical protein [Planctomycetaceae bacterium]